MDERNQIWTSVALMALVGGAITAFLYSDRGRQSLMRFEESLDEFGHSLQQLRSAVQKASHVAEQGIEVATEGMHAVSGLLAKRDQRPDAGATH